MWQTSRLTIRELRVDDWSDLHELQGDPQATQFVGGPWTPEKTQRVTKLIVASYPTNPWEWLAVADRQTDAVLGVCWLGNLNEKWCRVLGWQPSIELGYRLARRHWGKGYATETARAMLYRGFRELGLKRIVAIVDILNNPSERVLNKLGMRYAATGVHSDVTVCAYEMDLDGYVATQSTFISDLANPPAK
jgi:RimJ/RimL family protein N-acetyltransferase